MKFTLFLAIALLLVSGAYAEINVDVVNHNTDVQSTSSYLKVCSCGVTTDTVRVKNIGDLEASYTLALEATNGWFTLSKYSIYLAPNQTEDVPVFISAPCGAAGEASYTVHIASEYGRYRSVHKTVQSGVCENVAAVLEPQQLTVQPCGSEEARINITNTGTFPDDYTVNGNQTIHLEAGESGTITIPYAAACDEYGDKTVQYRIVSKRNQQEVQRELHVTVPRAYDFSVTTGAVDSAACLNTPVQVPVSVSNTEDRGNTFVINAPGSQEQRVYLGAGESRTIQLNYTPSATGEQFYTVSASGANGTIGKSATVRFNVEDCYSHTIEAPKEVTVCAGKLQVPFTIVGTGTRQQSIDFDVQSDMPTDVNSLHGIVNPGQQITKIVTATVSNMDGKHYVTLLINNSGKQATTAVNGYSTESCYRVEAQEHRFKVFTDQEVLPVIIKHTGVQPATYNVSYNGTVLVPLEDNMTLSPGQQAVLHFKVNASGNELGYHVERLSLTSNNVTYTTDFGVRLAEKGFWEHFKDAMYYNGSFAACSIISIIALLLFLVTLALTIGVLTGKIYYENPLWLSKETVNVIGSLLLIALLVMMVFSGLNIPRAYERPIGPSNASALYYEIGQADTLTLDLNKYFSDPDNEPLNYTASQPGNLRVQINNNTALIRPRSGFSGQETLVFTANDPEGGMTDSDLITVSVVPYKPVTFLEYWIYGCWFFTALFLFIAVALAMMIAAFGERRRSGPQHGQLVLYKRPRTHIVRSGAHDLVEQADTTIQPLPPGTNLGTVVNADKIVINQGKKDEIWIASEDGTKFHRITCPVIKNMPAEKRIVFDSREDAIRTGYTPCKTCSSHE